MSNTIAHKKKSACLEEKILLFEQINCVPMFEASEASETHGSEWPQDTRRHSSTHLIISTRQVTQRVLCL